jgi:hypothetical protein
MREEAVPDLAVVLYIIHLDRISSLLLRNVGSGGSDVGRMVSSLGSVGHSMVD